MTDLERTPDGYMENWSIEDTYGMCGSAWKENMLHIRKDD